MKPNYINSFFEDLEYSNFNGQQDMHLNIGILLESMNKDGLTCSKVTIK